MNINYTDLDISFRLMGMGMLGIFLVMIVISLLVYLFTKMTK